MSTAEPLGSPPVWEVALRKALSGFTLDLQVHSTAQRLVLFGPSGAGKTLLLRLVAGMLAPDAGRVAIAGRALFDSTARLNLPPRERRLGYVFQDYALFPHLTVRQNVGFSRQAGWWNPWPGARDPAVTQWLERLGLTSVADKLPHQISGGQRQRTALARALLGQPLALLLDEPFAALDRPLRRQLRQELLSLQQESALPLLLITHDDEDVDALAQQVLRLDNGRTA